MDAYRVIVAGGRRFDDYALLAAALDRLLAGKRTTHRVVILSGGCRGTDSMGEAYARSRGLAVEVHPADWDRDGRAAGPLRNGRMVRAADALVAFWDGASLGTRDVIALARKRGLAVRVVRYDRPAGDTRPPILPAAIRESIGR